MPLWGTASFTETTEVGHVYEVSFDADLHGATNVRAYARESNYVTAAQLVLTANGTYSYQFTAQTSSVTFIWQHEDSGNSPRDLSLDNVIVREINALGNYFLADVVNYSDYYPFGTASALRLMQMPGRHESDEDYRYGYQGSEKDDEVRGNGSSYTTFFRQLDPRVGRWLSIDPKMNAWESPYASMGNNPVLNNDVLGDTLKNEMEGVASNQALTEFMKTEGGFNQIKKYAAKGDVIACYTFTEDGVYSKNGIDLTFTDLPDSESQGTTTHELVDDRLKITINISSDVTVHPSYRNLKESDDNKGYETNSEQHKDLWNKAVAQKGVTITHELFIHAAIHSKDYLDGKMQYNIAGKTGTLHHNYVGCAIQNRMLISDGKVVINKSNANDITDLYVNSGWWTVKAINKSLNTGYTDTEILQDFSYGLHCLDYLEH